MARNAKLPRGIRNHNPGNIERQAEVRWQGAAADQSADPRFVVFDAPRWGIRAIARVLITYQDKHNLRTVEGVINRWAPPVENNTSRYVEFVRKRLGDLAPNSPIDIYDHAVAHELVAAIIAKENGVNPYSDAEIDDGLRLAGIEPPPKPIAASRTIQGSAVGAGATAIGLVAEAVKSTEPAIPLLQTALQTAPWIVGVLALAGIGYAIWARLDDHRNARR
jgi:hypothetical protein